MSKRAADQADLEGNQAVGNSDLSDDGKTLKLKGGRMLAYAEYGDPDGNPLFVFHGMPGSRFFMKVMDQPARSARLRVIAPDRPGYGLSQPDPHGTLLGYTKDILELAEALSLERFAVMGVSGGGPYALACAYELPERLTGAAVVSGIAPLSLPGSTQGMLTPNRVMFTLGRFSPALAGLVLSRMIRSSLPSMEAQVREGASPSPDLAPEAFAVVALDQREAIRGGGQGVTFDMKNLWRPWGFQFEEIRTPVALWHGEADNLAPARLAHVIAERLPGCRATFYPGEGHTDPITKHAGEIFSQAQGTFHLI